MAKKGLLTIDGSYRNTKGAVLTVDGVYRKVKKGLVTVNGVYKEWLCSRLPAGWTTSGLANFPVVRHRGMADALGEKIYCVGGYNGYQTSYSSVYVYDPSSNTYSTVASVPYSKGIMWGYHGVVGGELYLLGGSCWSDGAIGGETAGYKYNPSTNTWSAVTTNPYRSSSPAQGYGESHIADFSTSDGENIYWPYEYYNTSARKTYIYLVKYSPATNTYSQIANLNQNMGTTACTIGIVVAEGIAHLINYSYISYDDDGMSYYTPASRHYTVNVNTGTITASVSSPPAYTMGFLCYYNGYIYVFGTTDVYMYKYNVTTKTWTKITVPQYTHSATSTLFTAMTDDGYIYRINATSSTATSRTTVRYVTEE